MTTTVPAQNTPVRTSHFGLAVLALAMGGFAIGTTEFVTMGLLPQVADGVDISIPTAGHLISAYAVGVVVGAPVLAFFGAKWPRRGLLLVLMAAYGVFNALSALATSFELLTVARFLDGLPHGAYFGVASLVAASLAQPGPQGPGGRAGDARALGRQRDRRARRHLARPGRSAGARRTGASPGSSVLTAAMIVAFVPRLPGRPRGHRPARDGGVRASRRCG